MPIMLYMDEHVPKPLTRALRVRGANVLTAQEDGMAGKDDAEILARATALGRAVYTEDVDFLGIAARWQTEGRAFEGVIYAHGLYVAFSQRFNDLEIITGAGMPSDLVGRVEYLPLRI